MGGCPLELNNFSGGGKSTVSHVTVMFSCTYLSTQAVPVIFFLHILLPTPIKLSWKLYIEVFIRTRSKFGPGDLFDPCYLYCTINFPPFSGWATSVYQPGTSVHNANSMAFAVLFSIFSLLQDFICTYLWSTLHIQRYLICSHFTCIPTTDNMEVVNSEAIPLKQFKALSSCGFSPLCQGL